MLLPLWFLLCWMHCPRGSCIPFSLNPAKKRIPACYTSLNPGQLGDVPLQFFKTAECLSIATIDVAIGVELRHRCVLFKCEKIGSFQCSRIWPWYTLGRQDRLFWSHISRPTMELHKYELHSIAFYPEGLCVSNIWEEWCPFVCWGGLSTLEHQRQDN